MMKTPYRDFELTADSLSEAIEWIEAIEDNISKLKKSKEQQSARVESPSAKKVAAESAKNTKLQGEIEEWKVMYELEKKNNKELVEEMNKQSKKITELMNMLDLKTQENITLKAAINKKTGGEQSPITPTSSADDDIFSLKTQLSHVTQKCDKLQSKLKKIQDVIYE
ncbi:nuclear pore complex protein NUP62 [Acrasis kona]|uniref:Nuclear pore complex protein NUP62 n=1 Tax=Acrasis kona TaxID=1008807 RepID=A0AAW2YW22_9EUKA